MWHMFVEYALCVNDASKIHTLTAHVLAAFNFETGAVLARFVPSPARYLRCIELQLPFSLN